MNGAAGLSAADIQRIRGYVHRKYAPLSGESRAEIVAVAIRQALQRRLTDFPAEIRQEAADLLIRQMLAEKRRDIPAVDIASITKAIAMDRKQRRQTRLGGSSAFIGNGGGSALGRSRDGALAAFVSQPKGTRRLRNRRFVMSAAALLTVLLGIWPIAASGRADRPQMAADPSSINWVAVPAPTAPIDIPQPDKGMPAFLLYTDIDENALRSYLSARNAMLAEEPYFGAIMASAKDYNVHPALLFAIAGQEQGFVNKSSPNAKRIANNPFNVFHSWETYNTTIDDSANIAAKLIVKLGNRRPEGREPFGWFNETYAEDPNWNVGVRKIFDKLEGLSSSDN